MIEIHNVCLFSSILALLFKIGSERLVFLILSLTNRPYYIQQKALKQKRRQLATISAQDDFAKWARLNREVDADERQLRSSSHNHWLFQKVLSLVLCGFFVLLFAIAANKTRQYQFSLGGEIFMFSISPTFLLFILFFAFVRLFSLFVN